MQSKHATPAVEYTDCGLIELKFASNSDVMSFTGYGAAFGNIDDLGDMIAPGAFAKTIAQSKASGRYPAMLSQHGGELPTADSLTPIGVWTAMSEDSKGLRLEGVLAPTQRGQEMHALMKMQPRPAIDSLSIGYRAVRWDSGKKAGDPRRTIREIKLFEVSPVTFPANTAAQILHVKSRGGLSRPHDIRSFETALRDALGFSAREAKRLASAGWSAMACRDGERDQSKELAELLRTAAHTLSKTN